MAAGMDEDPNQPGSGAAPEPSDDLAAVDQAMLLALAHRQRGGTPLTVAQERLLDDWVAGRLAPAEADEAAELTKRNGLAAERVLERRLIAAADEGPPVPAALASRVLQAAPRKQPAAAGGGGFRLRWPALTGWQWSGFGAAVAATLVVAVIGLQVWQERFEPSRNVQVAMVTIGERGGLGPSRVRSLAEPEFARDGFRDVEIPADLVRRTIASAEGAARTAARTEWAPFLPGGADAAAQPTQVLIDTVLAERLAGEWRGRATLAVRIYDLGHPRFAAVRKEINVPLAAGRVLLAAPRP